MTRFLVCLIILAVVAIAIRNINLKLAEEKARQELAAKVALAQPHPFIDLVDVVTFEDKWELIPEATRLTGYFPQEGEIMSCVGKDLVPGDVAISPDLPLRYGDELLIIKDGVGIIEGTHIIKDKTAYWVKGTVDLYVRNPYVASAITGSCKVYRRVR